MTKTDDEWTWRGHTYQQVAPVLPDEFPAADDIEDSQRCWVGYGPATDEFYVGFDLWLAGDESAMAGGMVRIKLRTDGAKLVVASTSTERFSDSIYSGGTLDAIISHDAEMVELDVD